MEILYSFLGTMLAILIHDLFTITKKPKQVEQKVYKREVPKNIGRFADPLGEYDRYKDKVTNLYTSYVPKKTKRGEIDE